MIKAKMIKAVRTQEDITYTLKGEPDKVAQHQAVDFEGEACYIELQANTEDSQLVHDSIWEFAQRQARELDNRLRAEREIGKQEGYEKGLEEGANWKVIVPEQSDPDLAAIKEGVKSSVFSTLVHESPERQADVVAAHDGIDNGKDRY